MLQCGSVIGYGCNLRCEFCNTFSPYHKGYCPADELLASYTRWRKKVKPQYWILAGGEPLLHPDLARIVRESASIWNDSKLWLTTNGLLLERILPEVLQAIKETGCTIIISEHTFEPEHRERLDAGYARLKQEKIQFVVRPSRSTWWAAYRINERGDCVPYDSDPQKAWYCCATRACTLVAGDKLFKCAPLVSTYVALENGILDSEVWKLALSYKPLTLESTPEEIVKHLRTREVPACAICSEKCVLVPARQLPLKKKECVESVACRSEQDGV
jgi:MoaA/NifB/PqqE/SkfB family radical SAM enzyme